MATIRYSNFLASSYGKFILRNCHNISRHAAKRGLGTGAKAAGIAVSVALVGGYAAYHTINGNAIMGHKSTKVFAKDSSDDGSGKEQEQETQIMKAPIQLQHERFLYFASVQYDDSVYMTPQDFLESLLLDSARARTSRRHLKQNEVESYLKNTPMKKKASSHFFGDLFDRGLISYTEYLFLLCVLTKPASGFQIAFNMFDVDGDQKVDKKEFLLLQQLMAGNTARSLSEKEIKKVLERIPNKKHIWRTEAVADRNVRSNIRINIWNLLRLESRRPEDNSSEELQDTTLTTHFFGSKGKDVLKFEDFRRFMDGLQTEVLELEFHKFSRGLATIQEEDFARILLRYTVLTKDEHDHYLERLKRRVLDAKGITFKDFKEFFIFLNNLDDFALALRIYAYADLPISEVDFNRAVKACTGQALNGHLVHVVFQLFDRDGDGKLSQNEFISVMKDRLHRGGKAMPGGWWDNYKSCVKNEMK